MSFLNVRPEALTAAANDFEAIGSALAAAHATAATGTTQMGAMAADDVTAAVQAAFESYARGYQAVSAQAAAFHAGLVRTLGSGALAYLGTEIANAEQTIGAGVAAAGMGIRADVATAGQALVSAVNAPARALLGRPLIGNGGTTATTGGSGQATGGSTASGTGGGTPQAGTGGGTTEPIIKTDPGGKTEPIIRADPGGKTDPVATGDGGTVITAAPVTQTTAGQVNAATTVATTTSGSAVATGTSTTTGAITAPTTVPTIPSTTGITGTVTTSGTGMPVVHLDAQTPLGPVQVTVTEVESANGTVSWTGSVELPRPLLAAVDALGAQASASAAYASSVTAIETAVQTGHPLMAAEALARLPYNVANGYFYGQTSITEPLPVPPTYDGTAYATVPLGGLLASARPITVTLVPSTGAPEVVTLTGVEFGGLATALG